MGLLVAPCVEKREKSRPNAIIFFDMLNVPPAQIRSIGTWPIQVPNPIVDYLFSCLTVGFELVFTHRFFYSLTQNIFQESLISHRRFALKLAQNSWWFCLTVDTIFFTFLYFVTQNTIGGHFLRFVTYDLV